MFLVFLTAIFGSPRKPTEKVDGWQPSSAGDASLQLSWRHVRAFNKQNWRGSKHAQLLVNPAKKHWWHYPNDIVTGWFTCLTGTISLARWKLEAVAKGLGWWAFIRIHHRIILDSKIVQPIPNTNVSTKTTGSVSTKATDQQPHDCPMLIIFLFFIFDYGEFSAAP